MYRMHLIQNCMKQVFGSNQLDYSTLIGINNHSDAVNLNWLNQNWKPIFSFLKLRIVRMVAGETATKFSPKMVICGSKIQKSKITGQTHQLVFISIATNIVQILTTNVYTYMIFFQDFFNEIKPSCILINSFTQVQVHLKSSCSTPPLSVDIQSCRQSTTSSETVRYTHCC